MRGDFAQARPYLEAAGALREELLAMAPNDTQAMRLAMLSQNYLAIGYRALEGVNSLKFAAASERMYDLSEKLATADPANRTAQYDLAMTLTKRADFKLETGDPSLFPCYRIGRRRILIPRAGFVSWFNGNIANSAA